MVVYMSIYIPNAGIIMIHELPWSESNFAPFSVSWLQVEYNLIYNISNHSYPAEIPPLISTSRGMLYVCPLAEVHHIMIDPVDLLKVGWTLQDDNLFIGNHSQWLPHSWIPYSLYSDYLIAILCGYLRLISISYRYHWINTIIVVCKALEDLNTIIVVYSWMVEVCWDIPLSGLLTRGPLATVLFLKCLPGLNRQCLTAMFGFERWLSSGND